MMLVHQGQSSGVGENRQTSITPLFTRYLSAMSSWQPWHASLPLEAEQETQRKRERDRRWVPPWPCEECPGHRWWESLLGEIRHSPFPHLTLTKLTALASAISHHWYLSSLLCTAGLTLLEYHINSAGYKLPLYPPTTSHAMVFCRA